MLGKKTKKKWIHEGLITESLPNGMFRVHFDNEGLILGYISGKIGRSFIRILPGNRVKI
nr:translational initiation factor 1 [Lysimachia fortunei]